MKLNTDLDEGEGQEVHSPLMGEKNFEEDLTNGDEESRKVKPKESNIQFEDDEFYKRWAGPVLIGTFLPAVFSVFIVVSGQIVLQLSTGSCGFPLYEYIGAVIATCYLFLLVYTWVFLGEKIDFIIPIFNIKIPILRPYKSMKWLIAVYIIILIESFIVSIVGTAFLELSFICEETAPLLYSFSAFLVSAYWTGFAVIGAYLFKMFFGTEILSLVKASTRTSTIEEVEERIFKKKFSEIDTENEKRIKREDFNPLIESLGVFVPEEEQATLIATLDPEETGFIEYEVALEWFKKLNSDLDDNNLVMGETTGDLYSLDGGNEQPEYRSKKKT